MPRRLRWDGERWWVIDSRGEQEGAQVQVRLDAQRWMLLWLVHPVMSGAQRWMLLWFLPVGSSRGTWLWAQASVDPQRWHLLRCALYSPMTSATEGAVPRADAERA